MLGWEAGAARGLSASSGKRRIRKISPFRVDLALAATAHEREPRSHAERLPLTGAREGFVHACRPVRIETEACFSGGNADCGRACRNVHARLHRRQATAARKRRLNSASARSARVSAAFPTASPRRSALRRGARTPWRLPAGAGDEIRGPRSDALPEQRRVAEAALRPQRVIGNDADALPAGARVEPLCVAACGVEHKQRSAALLSPQPRRALAAPRRCRGGARSDGSASS